MFETKLLHLLPKDAIATIIESSKAATDAPTEKFEVVDGSDKSSVRGPDRIVADDFANIVCDWLPAYCNPLRTQRHKKNWAFEYGYRVSKHLLGE